MRRIGEDRLVEHVFPIAGEFLPRGDAAGDRTRAPAGAADHHALADLGRLRCAERQCRQVDLAERLHQAEAGLLVGAERVALDHAAVAQMQPDLLGLGDQIADGQHQPVVDQHAVAGALAAQGVGGEGVGRDDGVQARPPPTARARGRSRSPTAAAARRRELSIRAARACYSHPVAGFIIRGTPSERSGQWTELAARFLPPGRACERPAHAGEAALAEAADD